MGVVNLPSGKPTLMLTGGAAERLQSIMPPGMVAQIDLTITDDFPQAQAIVIISAIPLEPQLHVLRKLPLARRRFLTLPAAAGLIARGRARRRSRRSSRKMKSIMSRKTSGGLSEFWEIVKRLGRVIAIVIRTFAYEPFNIPSGSMVPTLLVGDYLFVSRWPTATADAVPWRPAAVQGRIWAGAPTRGDVVVFRPTREPETDYIKRFIGLPGDSIQVRDGILHINGEPVKRQRIED